MNNREKWLLEKVKNYALIAGDIVELTDRLGDISYTMTANYGAMPSSGSFESSKVENIGSRRVDMEREIAKKTAIIKSIDEAVEKAGLNKRERDLIQCTISGYSLSAYARKANIYKSHVYKIRDAALKKMVKYIFRSTK